MRVMQNNSYYQCCKCNQIFKYSNLSENAAERHLSPCCKRNYKVIGREVDKYFESRCNINFDVKYYEY